MNPAASASGAPLTLASVRRDHGRALLTLSTGETIAMPRAMLRERPYRGGAPFDRAAFDAFMEKRAPAFALERAVSLLSVRERTEGELRAALERSAYPDFAVDRALSRLAEAGYLNDADFAARFASSRSARGLGERRIRMELRRRGVASEEIDGAMDALDGDARRDAALLAARKAARGRDLESPDDRRKLLAALARRGFDYTLAKEALARIREEARANL